MQNFDEYFKNKVNESLKEEGFEILQGVYSVVHEHFSTKHYEYGTTKVKANSKE